MRAESGDAVVLRYFIGGCAVGARPTRVVSARDGLVLWLAPATPVRWPTVGDRHIRDVPVAERFAGPWGSMERRWEGDGVVIVQRPGRAHSIWLFSEAGRFAGWYVNLEAPWRPSAIGFDTSDHTLDIWVDAEGAWRWKDEDELEIGVAGGFYTAAEAAAIRAEGEQVIAEWPFPTGWESWRSDPSWPVPDLPPAWDGGVRMT